MFLISDIYQATNSAAFRSIQNRTTLVNLFVDCFLFSFRWTMLALLKLYDVIGRSLERIWMFYTNSPVFIFIQKPNVKFFFQFGPWWDFEFNENQQSKKNNNNKKTKKKNFFAFTKTKQKDTFEVIKKKKKYIEETNRISLRYPKSSLLNMFHFSKSLFSFFLSSTLEIITKCTKLF